MSVKRTHVPAQESVEISPKYLTLNRLEAEYGISRGKASRLITAGHLKVIHLVDEGRSRGKLLIVAETVEKYLKSLEAAE